jgi:hypothetical protein
VLIKESYSRIRSSLRNARYQDKNAGNSSPAQDSTYHGAEYVMVGNTSEELFHQDDLYPGPPTPSHNTLGCKYGEGIMKGRKQPTERFTLTPILRYNQENSIS